MTGPMGAHKTVDRGSRNETMGTYGGVRGSGVRKRAWPRSYINTVGVVALGLTCSAPVVFPPRLTPVTPPSTAGHACHTPFTLSSPDSHTPQPLQPSPGNSPSPLCLPRRLILPHAPIPSLPLLVPSHPLTCPPPPPSSTNPPPQPFPSSPKTLTLPNTFPPS